MLLIWLAAICVSCAWTEPVDKRIFHIAALRDSSARFPSTSILLRVAGMHAAVLWLSIEGVLRHGASLSIISGRSPSLFEHSGRALHALLSRYHLTFHAKLSTSHINPARHDPSLTKKSRSPARWPVSSPP